MELKLVDTVYTNAPKDFAPTRITTYSNSSKGDILTHIYDIKSGESVSSEMEIHIYSLGGIYSPKFISAFPKKRLPRKIKKRLNGKR
jgi:hypothetical protein